VREDRPVNHPVWQRGQHAGASETVAPRSANQNGPGARRYSSTPLHSQLGNDRLVRAQRSAAVEHVRFSQWSLAPFHLGSLIGPYTGGGFPIVFPILQGLFHVDRATLSVIVPAYFVTFRLCQFFSGTIADLTSRRGTLLVGFASFGLAALLCAVARTYLSSCSAVSCWVSATRSPRGSFW